MIFAVISASAQQKQVKYTPSKGFTYSFLNTTYSKIYNNLPVSGLPGNFYSCNLGFFCKEELKVEKAVKIPLKLRLGSVQYVDWMEGKNGAGILKPVN